MRAIDRNQLIKWRRNFHHFPEIGWTEFVTTGTLITVLRQLSFEVRTGTRILSRDAILGRDETLAEEAMQTARSMGISEALLTEMEGLTGCMAVLDSGRPGPILAFRFDIDAVPIDESEARNHKPAQEGFASCRPGIMHACGHDAHMAIGLGLATWLSQNKTQLKGCYKLLFQPAEEGVRGAAAMCARGLLQDVTYLLSLHIGCNMPLGAVSLNSKDFLCTTKLDITFTGEPAHAGADPHKGRNALAGACMAATQMLAAPRHGEGMSRINVGILNAGEGRNVIPAHACLQIETRGKTAAINEYILDYVHRCVDGAARTHQLTAQIDCVGTAIDFTNDLELVEILQSVIAAREDLHLSDQSLGGSEDISLMIQSVQQQGGKAAFCLIGADQTDGHHKRTFDIDEHALDIAVSLLVQSVLRILGQPGMTMQEIVR